jgi:hypothetical protein
MMVALSIGLAIRSVNAELARFRVTAVWGWSGRESEESRGGCSGKVGCTNSFNHIPKKMHNTDDPNERSTFNRQRMTPPRRCLQKAIVQFLGEEIGDGEQREEVGEQRWIEVGRSQAGFLGGGKVGADRARVRRRAQRAY